MKWFLLSLACVFISFDDHPDFGRYKVTDVEWKVTEITKDAKKFDLPTAKFKRVADIAGWIELTGPGVDNLAVGDVITITKKAK